jgi:hypothetical protein
MAEQLSSKGVQMRTEILKKVCFGQLLAVSICFSHVVLAQSVPDQSLAGHATVEPLQDQAIDKFLLKRPPVEQVDGYFRLVQYSLRELGDLQEVLDRAKAEPNAAIRAMKVAAVELKIADEKARLAIRQSRLATAEKLYGHGTASARQAKMLRVGGPSLKALPAVALGAGVIFAGTAAANQTSEIRAVSVTAEGPAPVRLEKSNIGATGRSDLESEDGTLPNTSASTNSLARKSVNARTGR